jgi:hypothetical protein
LAFGVLAFALLDFWYGYHANHLIAAGTLTIMGGLFGWLLIWLVTWPSVDSNSPPPRSPVSRSAEKLLRHLLKRGFDILYYGVLKDVAIVKQWIVILES